MLEEVVEGDGTCKRGFRDFCAVAVAAAEDDDDEGSTSSSFWLVVLLLELILAENEVVDGLAA